MKTDLGISSARAMAETGTCCSLDWDRKAIRLTRDYGPQATEQGNPLIRRVLDAYAMGSARTG